MTANRRRRVRPAVACLVLAACAVAPAMADPAAPDGAGTPDAPAPPERVPGWIDEESPREPSYWVSGGALPFVYGSLLGWAGAELLLEPPSTPLLFPADEGGAEPRGDTVPDAAVGGIAAAGLLALLIPDTDARWYHAKGFAEAALTTAFLTTLVKNVVGRHRPSFEVDDPGVNPDDSRRSFFSGHSSGTLSTTVYLGLYLHGHVFEDRASPGAIAAYVGLGAASVLVPASRIADNRHHLSDVLVGGGVGTAAAVAFYAWQERRWRARRRGGADRGADAVLLPHPGGLVLSIRR